MGAWIETDKADAIVLSIAKSHPVWVRGLKQVISIVVTHNLLSHPVWVRGLKLSLIVFAH